MLSWVCSSQKTSKCGKNISDTLSYHLVCHFFNVSYEDIKGLALRSINKSCVLDPLPAVVMKECFNLLTPVSTNIVNTSISSGVMPDVLKIAAVTVQFQFQFYIIAHCLQKKKIQIEIN